MYKYKVFSNNPEFTNWYLTLEHNTKFTEKKFKSLCEEAFTYAITEEQKIRKYVSNVANQELVLRYLESKGFSQPTNNILYNYHYDPYNIEQRYFSKKFQKTILENDKRNKENF